MQTKPNEWLVRNAVSVLEVVDAPQLEGAGELEVGLPVRARRVVQHDQGRAARARIHPGLRDPVLLQLQQGSSRAPFYKTPLNLMVRPYIKRAGNLKNTHFFHTDFFIIFYIRAHH